MSQSKEKPEKCTKKWLFFLDRPRRNSKSLNKFFPCNRTFTDRASFFLFPVSLHAEKEVGKVDFIFISVYYQLGSNQLLIFILLKMQLL